MMISCKKEDLVAPGSGSCTTGTLHCVNTSLHTVQRILINNTNYGSLDPGGSMDIELAPGNWTVEFVGLSGGSGCSPSSFNITACQTVGRSCSY